MTASSRLLLTAIIDYAGLFPPAKLRLQSAISNYRKYSQTRENWMLGHFVFPVSRLTELEADLVTSSSVKTLVAPFSLSVILSENWELELKQIQAFNQKNHLQIAAVEFKPLTPREIPRAISHLPKEIESFFEITLDENLELYLAVLKETNASAKIRTGGLTAGAFPKVDQLCQFIFASAEAQVPFKATAGLHHPLAGNYVVSYQTNSFSVNMQGFLNLSILAALVYWQKLTRSEALTVLQESSLANFKFQEEDITWQNHSLNPAEIQESRKCFFRSFGSCSFQEPLDSLRRLQLL
ncbi:hypothetical protein Xen7305DRAFT_00047390 [Xenococcus sp. PCC 7305]|uniref:hypothetical protein n=1 Tax=Xenococcus sp. PCC 7305 TaxID=102125 RepID=UPI0002ABD700|nr:hypothetical protein [Xenococcus sp. PCC 7305]ELS05001.1 hypothetical protein Xen7305DRAFT_00047390 [Xenococcus sp. PCC 7305]